MLPVFVRPFLKTDVQTFIAWAKDSIKNELDPGIMAYPKTTVRCAYDKHGPLVFLPIQRPLHMDTVVKRPGASELEVAQALMVLLQDTITTAHTEGVGEVYFLSTEDTVPGLAIKRGFEKLPWTVYRLKLKDLEPKECAENEQTRTA